MPKYNFLGEYVVKFPSDFWVQFFEVIDRISFKCLNFYQECYLCKKIVREVVFTKICRTYINLGLLQELFCEKLVGLVFFSKVQGPNFSQEIHTV